MQKSEVIRGYETEIAYQKKMIDNLGRWFSLMFLLASLGMIFIYTFKSRNLLALLAGIFLAILGILAMLVFGYGIYKGRQNVQQLMAEFERKLKKS